MRFNPLSRRRLLQGAGMAALAGALPIERAFAKDTTVGFIYVGPRDDFGYNQAHAEGAAALKKMSGVKVVEEERVPETVQVAKTMESMINLDGASLLFPTSFGYFDPYILDEAAKFPKVRFEHAGGLWTEKTRRTSAAISATYSKANTSTASLPATRPRAANSASSPPSRSRRCCRTSTPSPWVRGRQSESHDAGHLHRRLVAAGQGGGGDQQHGRPGHRRASPCMSTAPRWWCRPRQSAAPWSAAITPAKPSSRPRPI